MRRQSAFALCLFFIGSAAVADQEVQGFIVVTDEAKIYKRSKADERHGDEVVHTARRGDALVGVQSGLFGAHVVGGWTASEVDGRLRVKFLNPTDRAGKFREAAGWVEKDAVVSFRYECGCGGKAQVLNTSSDDECSPFRRSLSNHVVWNECFLEGLEKKTEAIASRARADGPPSKPSVEERLKALEDLFRKQLITREEYDSKRAEILKEM